MANNNKPVLVLPAPQVTFRSKKPPNYPANHVPGFNRQRERLTPQFEQLQRSFENQRLTLQNQAEGATPESVLVLETIGPVQNLYKAVSKLPEMEWLFELEDEIDPSEDFYNSRNPESKLSGRLYLVTTNQRAMVELLRLWELYCANPTESFPRGLAPWKELFKHLVSIRFWDVQDRLEVGGMLDAWNQQLESGNEQFKFEIELWFHKNPHKRAISENKIISFVRECAGRIISITSVPEIQFHAILAELPADSIISIIEQRSARLIRSADVMLFRPIGQIACEKLNNEATEIATPRPNGAGGEPVVALLDGLPLSNHLLLHNRLTIDDPDDWASEYQAGEQVHGTAMASLIIHGELDNNEPPLSRLVYVRPLMKPDINDRYNRFRQERIPEEILAVDLVHRAFKRMLEGEGDTPATAPNVKIVNLSLGDTARPFDRNLSPWGRLLDWLSFKYKLLILVSSGNYKQEITLGIDRNNFNSLTPENLQKEVLKALFNDSANRRLLSPSEAINCVTVAALHYDTSVPSHLGNRINVYVDSMPSPINALGLGYRRAIKPEILMPGGRQLYTEKLGTTHTNATLQVSYSIAPPGQSVAAPGATPGDINKRIYTRGTSNATALATRQAAQLLDQIIEIQSGPGGELILSSHIPILIKALLTHYASWEGLEETIKSALQGIVSPSQMKDQIARLVGFGAVNKEKAMQCTDQRVTMIGCGNIKKDEGQIFFFPLPPSLSGVKTWKRLTITLAWLTPTNPSHRSYRHGALWFDTPLDTLQLKRNEAHGRSVQRGTIQHEILVGEDASAFVDGELLKIQVNCREDAGGLTHEIPFALSATLEVKEDSAIPIYQEVRDRIRTTLQVAV